MNIPSMARIKEIHTKLISRKYLLDDDVELFVTTLLEMEKHTLEWYLLPQTLLYLHTDTIYVASYNLIHA